MGSPQRPSQPLQRRWGRGRCAALLVATTTLFWAPSARANDPWEITFVPEASLSVVEGHDGTRLLRVPVKIYPPMPLAAPISGTFTARSGLGNNRAIAGPACTAGVDFVEIRQQPFTIPAGFSGSFGFDVQICGDRVPEPHKQIDLVIQNTARCGAGTGWGCQSQATIIDDDGTSQFNPIPTTPSFGRPPFTHNAPTIQQPPLNCRKLANGLIDCSNPQIAPPRLP